MKRRVFLPMLVGIALAATVSASNAEARVFRPVRGRTAPYYRSVQRVSYGPRATRATRATETRSTFPRWTWSAPLEVRTWKWPPYYRH